MTPACRHLRLRVEEQRFADGYNRMVEVCQNGLCEAWVRAAIKPRTEAAKTGKTAGKVKATRKKKGELDLSKLNFRVLTIEGEWEARGGDLMQTNGDMFIITRMPQTNRASFRARAMAWFENDEAALERALTATAVRAFGAPPPGADGATQQDFTRATCSKTRAASSMGESQADGSTAILSRSRSGTIESTTADPAHPSRLHSEAQGKAPPGSGDDARRREVAAQPESHGHVEPGGSSFNSETRRSRLGFDT